MIEINGKTIGEKNHLDMQGDDISYRIGDTFIDYKVQSPMDQWMAIVRMLDAHGYKIVDKEDR